MSMIDTMGSGFSELKNNFNYGPHPSIIMWSNGPAVEVEAEDGFFGGAAKALEDTFVSGGVPETFNSFKFDAMVSEEHSDDTIVTKFPVSSGFLVSDHVINQNRVLKLKAVAVNMQNASMWSASVQGLSVVTGAIFNNPVIPIIGGALGGIASAFETSDRVQSTYELFNTFRTTGKKLYISTILGPYLNCVVTNVKSVQDKMSSAMLSVEITLEELQVIEEDTLATEARKAMQNMYDYSDFAKIAQSIGVGVLGGAPLPGLGVARDAPSKQLNVLKDKVAKLAKPISSIKGKII